VWSTLPMTCYPRAPVLLVRRDPDDEVTGPGRRSPIRRQGVPSRWSPVTGGAGEILAADLASCGRAPDELGRYPDGRLATRADVLGIKTHYWLGSGRRWWDSEWSAAGDEDPRAFVRRTRRRRRRDGRGAAPGASHRGCLLRRDRRLGHRTTSRRTGSRWPRWSRPPTRLCPRAGEPWRVPRSKLAGSRAPGAQLAETMGLGIADDMPGVPDESITARSTAGPTWLPSGRRWRCTAAR